MFSVAFGTERTHAFMNDHAAFEGCPDSYVTDVRVTASRGGVSIIAMQWTARKGTTFTIVSKVAMMTDDRTGVEHVVTEYGRRQSSH